MAYDFRLSGAEVAGLSEQIKQAVANAGYTQEELKDIRVAEEFDGVKGSDPSQSVNVLALNPEATVYSRKWLNRMVKRTIAKLIRWYICIPIAVEQTTINLHFATANNRLRNQIASQQVQIDQLVKKVEGLERRKDHV